MEKLGQKRVKGERVNFVFLQMPDIFFFVLFLNKKKILHKFLQKRENFPKKDAQKTNEF